MDTEFKMDDTLNCNDELDDIKEKINSAFLNITELDDKFTEHRLNNCDDFEEINGIFEMTIDSIKKLNDDFYKYKCRTDRLLSVVLYTISIDIVITLILVILVVICR